MKTLLLSAVFVLEICSHLIGGGGAGGSAVKFLPGFDGPLPFNLRTGYIGVGDSESVQLFYYFIQSQSGHPESDPLFLWINGGPGCSTLSGIIFEIGPITFAPLKYNGSLPTLISRPYSWTKVANIIFLDLPVGTGFSYATNQAAHRSNSTQACHHAYDFLRKGYILGNPLTFPEEADYKFPYAHGMGLISDELFESLKKNCEGVSYLNINPENVKCYADFQTFKKLTSIVNEDQILEAKCNETFGGHLRRSKEGFEFSAQRKLLMEKSNQNINLHGTSILGPECFRAEWYDLSYLWANEEMVRDALHVRKESMGEWRRCNSDLDYVFARDDVTPYHANLSAKGYRSLIYSGDHDFTIPFLSTQAWIRSLNYSIVDEWRPWMGEDQQVAGYTRSYTNKMTFATVKGGGHTAPEYKPKECLAMLTRWLSYQPL
ncbi:hypothetical protein DM860_006656 [Cuscuta australis]|uniref:Uncharacterized protein n=1 Tax=Cuscuta australis TaxID=267555 RepID=A0A328D4W2_9ASTE|nr:hypothetical protein DM860_006656 [Cuscuta australis]